MSRSKQAQPVATSAAVWLERNKNQFGSHDGYPGEFQRRQLFSKIGVGKAVAFLSPQGQVRTGRAVMKSKGAGWVLNMGGAHGTPGLCDAGTVVWVQGTKDLVGGSIP